MWGASNYTYAEATLSQTLPDWIGSHVRAFQYFTVIPRMLIPDNLKSGVSKACFYEPELNPTYAEMAGHYGCAVLPARPAKPRDKAKAEAGVLVAQRWILAVLRKRSFHSLLLKSGDLQALVDKGALGPVPEKNTFGWYVLAREFPDRFEEVQPEDPTPAHE